MTGPDSAPSKTISLLVSREQHAAIWEESRRRNCHPSAVIRLGLSKVVLDWPAPGPRNRLVEAPPRPDREASK